MRSVREFCCPQEIIVSRRTYLDALDALRVYQHVVEIPEIDVWQVLGQYPLNLIVDSFALLLIDGVAAFANQFIHARVGIEGAIGALGSEAVGAEDVLEDIRVQVTANPA